jgi:hypothetical protein
MWTTSLEGEVRVAGQVVTAVRADFDSFYRAELPRLVALARALCGAALAEDVAQEAMLAAYRRWKHVRDLASPAEWVRRTCANVAAATPHAPLVHFASGLRVPVAAVGAEVDTDEAGVDQSRDGAGALPLQ